MIACWIHNLLTVVTPQTRAIANHRRHCARCRTQVEQDHRLGQRLTPPHPDAFEALPAGFSDRLARELRQALNRPTRTQPRSTGHQRWLPLTAAVAAVTLLFCVPQHAPAPRTPGDATASINAPILPPLDHLTQPALLPALADSLQQPLATEVNDAFDDGHRLLAGVVYSVLPDATAQAVMDRTARWLEANRPEVLATP